jgi:hypothetical protein
MKEAERHAELVELWLQRPENERTGNDVLMFHADMEREHPELLSLDHESDNRYQELHTVLRHHIRESPR